MRSYSAPKAPARRRHEPAPVRRADGPEALRAAAAPTSGRDGMNWPNSRASPVRAAVGTVMERMLADVSTRKFVRVATGSNGAARPSARALDMGLATNSTALPQRCNLGTLGRSESRAAGFSLQPDPAAQRRSMLSLGGEHLPRRRQSPARAERRERAIGNGGQEGLCRLAPSRACPVLHGRERYRCSYVK